MTVLLGARGKSIECNHYHSHSILIMISIYCVYCFYLVLSYDFLSSLMFSSIFIFIIVVQRVVENTLAAAVGATNNTSAYYTIPISRVVSKVSGNNNHIK